MSEGLMLLVHGDPKVGKTTLGFTSPAPRLVLDSENGARFRARTMGGGVITWNPSTDEPPTLGEWETCIVPVSNFDTLGKVFAWLNARAHPFRSVVLDTISDIQRRCKDDLLGGDDVVSEREWGQLLVRMERLIAQYRDLTMHEKNPIENLIILSHSQERNGRCVPLIQGRLSKTLPGFVDVIGYLAVVADPNTGAKTRRMLVSTHPEYEAGDRVGCFEALGAIDNPNVEQMIQQVNDYLEGR